MRILFILFALLFSSLQASYDWRQFIPTRQTIVSFDAYAGDGHREFAGNPVAILSDGSVWKIHPKDGHFFSQ